MKVNIIGKFSGQYLNGVGILPQRGIELTEAEVRRLLNFRDIRVFDATSGGLLTKASFDTKKKPVTPAPEKTDIPSEPAAPSAEKPVLTSPIIEPVKETYETPEVKIDEPSPVIETPSTPIEKPEDVAYVVGVDLAEKESTTEESVETVEEEKPRQNFNNGGYNKKNKKNRYRDQHQNSDKE